MSRAVRREQHVVALMGRFGNQLFQVSFSRWLARTTGRRVLYDLCMVGGPDGVEGPDEFRRRVIDRSTWGIERSIKPTGRLVDLGRLIRLAEGPHRVVIDGSLGGHGSLNSLRPAWWFGYWQQEVFAQSAKEEISSLFPPDAISRPRAPKPTIGVHVRRGDYVGLGNALSADWYWAAVQQARTLLGEKGTIVVQSDDPEWCRMNLPFADFVAPASVEPMAAFSELASCNCLVMSASTFSWWAGFLGGMPVVYPDWHSFPPAPHGWFRLSTHL